MTYYPLDRCRDDETARECWERWERITGLDYGLFCADWLDARIANSPRTFHPTSHDLPARPVVPPYSREADDWDDLDEVLADASEIQAALVEHQAIQREQRIHPKDAARQAAHGYSVEAELRAVGPEPSDLLPDPADWINIGEDGN